MTKEQEQPDDAGDALEALLIARSQRGDRAAFNQLVERHQTSAYALAFRMLGEAEAAADVTQDAFFSAFRAIGSFHGGSFRAWLLRIVSNGCYDQFRVQGRRPTTSLDALLGESTGGDRSNPNADLQHALTDATHDPEQAALRGERIDAIQAALLRLAPEQRLAVILSDVQGLAYDEIARIMNIPLGTVKSRIARARGHLRELLLREGELFGRAQRRDTERH